MTAIPSVAEFDQLFAEARFELGALRQTMNNQQAKHGEIQGMANVVTMLWTWDPSRVIAALAAALGEDAGGAR